MSRKIETINIIEVYEENNIELTQLKSEKPSIIIREHWNIKDFVIIKIKDISYTVYANDLQKAIQNVQNAH